MQGWTCPSCGAAHSPFTWSCPHCGPKTIPATTTGWPNACPYCHLPYSQCRGHNICQAAA